MKQITLVLSILLSNLVLVFGSEFVAPETLHIRPFFRFPVSKYYTITSNLLRKQGVSVPEGYGECSSLQGPRCLYQKISKDFESIAGLELDEGVMGGLNPGNIKVVMLDGKEVKGDLTEVIQKAFDKVQEGDSNQQHFDANVQDELGDIDLSQMLDEKVIRNLANQVANQLGVVDVDIIYEQLQASLADPEAVQVKYFDLRPNSPKQSTQENKQNQHASNQVEDDDDEYLDDVEDEPTEETNNQQQKSQTINNNNNNNSNNQKYKKVVVEKVQGEEVIQAQDLLNSEAWKVLKNEINLGEDELRQIEQALQQKGFVVLDEQNHDDD